MTPLLLNCDLGERGGDDPTDHALMPLVQIANLACGGQAGDAASARHFATLAARHGVRVTAHLSYPDPAHFGRRSLTLSWAELAASLTHQRALLPEVTWLKLHGALYHDAATRDSLADAVARWARSQAFTQVLAPSDSALASAAARHGLAVMGEVFAERRYTRDAQGRLGLVPRSLPYASITDLPGAVAQVRAWLATGTVPAVVAVRADGTLVTEPCTLLGQTVCVHSDSPLALPLLTALAQLRRGAGQPKQPEA